MRRGIGCAGGFVGLLVALAMLAGCGGTSGSGNADPASLVPASTPLYASVAIKPAGGENGAANVAAKTLTHLPEPYGTLAQSLLSSAGGKPEFKREISPWVGERAGVFITALDTAKLTQSAGSLQSLLEGGLTGLPGALGAGSFGARGTQGAVVLQTSDSGGARSFLAKRASEQGAHSGRYRGVSFEVSPAGVATGIVKNFAVVGSETGMRSVIDTSIGGAALSTASGYSAPPSGAIATAYVKPQAFAGSPVPLLGQLFAGAQSATLTATATANQISLQGEIHSAGAGSSLFGTEGAQALGELPGTSWLAAGVGDAGANLPRALALLRGVASLGASSILSSFGGPSIEKLFETLTSPRAHLQRDFGAWAGPAGLFVSGSGLLNLQAGLVVASKQPAASRAAVAKLGALMREAGAVVTGASIPGTDAALSVKLTGFPAVVFIADGAGKFILGLGQQSVEAALSPSATLSTSAAYSNAKAALGGIEPNLIVEFPTLLGFLEGIGLTQSPSLSGVVPYLKSLGTLSAGARNQAGVEHYKLVLGLA